MRELDKKLNKAFQRLGIKPGDIYEDCSYHPVLCLGVDYKRGDIWGVSMIDGSYPRSCSLVHCGVRKLSPKQAWQIKMHGPLDLEVRENFSPESRWWRQGTDTSAYPVRLVGPRSIKPAAPKPRHKNGG